MRPGCPVICRASLMLPVVTHMLWSKHRPVSGLHHFDVLGERGMGGGSVVQPHLLYAVQCSSTVTLLDCISTLWLLQRSKCLIVIMATCSSSPTYEMNGQEWVHYHGGAWPCDTFYLFLLLGVCMVVRNLGLSQFSALNRYSPDGSRADIQGAGLGLV